MYRDFRIFIFLKITEKNLPIGQIIIIERMDIMTILTGCLIGLTAAFFMWLLKDKKRGLSEAAGAYVLFLSSFFFHTPATAMATALVLLGYGICLCFIK